MVGVSVIMGNAIRYCMRDIHDSYYLREEQYVTIGGVVWCAVGRASGLIQYLFGRMY